MQDLDVVDDDSASFVTKVKPNKHRSHDRSPGGLRGHQLGRLILFNGPQSKKSRLLMGGQYGSVRMAVSALNDVRETPTASVGIKQS
jgi:hypothetical protein